MKYEIETEFFWQRLRANDSEAFIQLADAWTVDLYKMGRTMRLSSESIEDVIQETFIALKRKIHDFEGNSKLKTFTIGIFINKAREQYRFQDKGNTAKVEEILDKNFGPNGHWLRDADPQNPELLKLEQERLAILNDCISKLTNQYREAISLTVDQELSSKEICNILNISATNLRQIIFRAKQSLRICVEDKVSL